MYDGRPEIYWMNSNKSYQAGEEAIAYFYMIAPENSNEKGYIRFRAEIKEAHARDVDPEELRKNSTWSNPEDIEEQIRNNDNTWCVNIQELTEEELRSQVTSTKMSHLGYNWFNPKSRSNPYEITEYGKLIEHVENLFLQHSAKKETEE